MTAFEVRDMTCGHCARTVTEAVKSVDPEAMLAIDLAAHRVEIESSRVDSQALAHAIEQAGYSPVPL